MSEEQKANNEDEMIIDTSGMSDEQREALEVAEAARDTNQEHPSFGGQMFMGNFDFGMMHPFPEQSEEDRNIGDEYISKLSKYLKDHLNPDDVDETRTIPEDVIAGMAKMGVFAMKIPKEYGGVGLSQVNYNRVMAMISSYCGSTAVLVSAHQSIGVPQPLKMFGTQKQKEEYLPRFGKGAISAFALTESDVGSDPARLSTEAKLSDDGEHYILNGTKLWCTNGLIADVMVVMAQTEPKIVRGKERKQITAFIVEKEMPGIKYVHRCDFMGLRGIQNGVIEFHDVKVPVENIIMEKGKGLKLALMTLNTGRLTIPAACAGMARQCLSIVRRWGSKRKQWGAEIGKHEFGAYKIATIASSTLAIEAVTWISSHWADRGDIDMRIEAAMAKLFCSEQAWKIIDMTLQARGGRGYEKATSLAGRGEDPFPVERMLRDCRINTIIEGTSDIMRLFLAREALDPHLRGASDVIKRGVPIKDKLKAGAKLGAFYSKWYSKQWVNSSYWADYEGMSKLSEHLVFIEQKSHKLARSIFMAMGRYQANLEKRQMVLGHLVEIGTELFAMSATCSYAKMLSEKDGADKSVLDLADLFCKEAIRRIDQHFERLSDNSYKAMNEISSDVLKGQYEWMEQGIIPADDASS